MYPGVPQTSDTTPLFHGIDVMKLASCLAGFHYERLLERGLGSKQPHLYWSLSVEGRIICIVAFIRPSYQFLKSHLKIFIDFFLIQYILSILSSPPALLWSSSPTRYPPKFIFLSLKKIKKKTWVCFVLSNYSWAWGLPWTVVERPTVTSSEKMIFPFSSRC